MSAMANHNRSTSIQDFREQGTNATSKAMRNELNKLATLIKDETRRKNFEAEMDNFYFLFNRYLLDRAKGTVIDWEKIKSPGEDQVRPYGQLPESTEDRHTPLLNKLVVLKLNGGLGTTMGCVGPKSAIEVRDSMTFLDLTVRQIEYVNEKYGCNIPLVLMNSFNTDDETKRIIQKYSGHQVNILTFNQSRHPRIGKDSNLPIPRSPDSDKGQWYPPGHGDIYESLFNSGLLESLLSQGKEYIFISNVDNLGAVVDLKILQHFADSNSEFIMEVTDKTRADVKGGTLIDYDGVVRLLEIAQVPAEHVDDFKSVKKFKIFNTNNLWISLKAIKRVVEEKELDLEIIVNPKTIPETGEKVIQLETAVGAAIKHFKGAHGINVPRARFLPVKSTDDLFLVQSDLYRLTHGELVLSPKRQFSSVPLIKLGDEFRKVSDFLKRFKSPPYILELDHLTVTGDVTFGSGVHLRGTVIVVANHGSRIDIPSGAILENKVVSGNLRILDH